MLQPVQTLLSKTFTQYKENASLMLGYSAWFIAPTILYVAATLVENPMWGTSLMITGGLLQVFIAMWIYASVMMASEKLSAQQPIEPTEISQRAMKRISTLLAVSILQMLIVMGGFILLIIPGIIFTFWYGFSITIAALEDTTAMEALKKSKELVKGRLGSVAWRLLAGPFVLMLIYVALFAISSGIGALLSGTGLEAAMSSQPPIWITLSDALIEIIMLPLFLIYGVHLYKDLKQNPLEKQESVA